MNVKIVELHITVSKNPED